MLELGAPLRVTWELPADTGLVRSCWEKLREGRALFVEAHAHGNLGASLVELAEAVRANPGPRLTVVTGAEGFKALMGVEERRFLDVIEGVLMPPYPKLPEIAKLAVYFRNFTIGLWSDPEGITHFPEALDLVRGSQNLGVSVINPPVVEGKLIPSLREEERSLAKASWELLDVKPERVHIHDLFLSEALGLKPFESYGGCAAAKSLAHLRADGKLVACRTLPLPLGDLTAQGLEEIWANPIRDEARKRIEETPHGCLGCEHANVCRGGCPGLAKGAGLADLSCTRAKR